MGVLSEQPPTVRLAQGDLHFLFVLAWALTFPVPFSVCLSASAVCSLFLSLGLCFLSVCLSAHQGMLPQTHGPCPGPSSAPGQSGRHPDCGWATFCPLARDGEDEGHHVAGPLYCAQGTGPPVAVGSPAALGGSPTQGVRVHSAVYSPETRHRFFFSRK